MNLNSVNKQDGAHSTVSNNISSYRRIHVIYFVPFNKIKDRQDNIYWKIHICYKYREIHDNNENQYRPVVICVGVRGFLSNWGGDRKDIHVASSHYSKYYF